MAQYEIQDLEALLAPILGPNSQILDVKISNLVLPGENYTSLIFSVEIATTKNGKIRAVAKTIPRSHHLKIFFQSEKTFRHEVGFYEKIAPLMRKLQLEEGVKKVFDSYPDFYAARVNLNAAGVVDENAVLLIKNVTDDGFSVANRRVGLDLDQSRKVLEKVAELHATFLALKSKQPRIFETISKDFFEEFTMYQNSDGVAPLEEMIQSFMELLEGDAVALENHSLIRDALFRTGRRTLVKNSPLFQKSKFTTLIHCDLWINNIMLKVEDGVTTDLKFVDFQLYEYSSSAWDVIFFLLTSVQLPVIRVKMDELLLFYFESFVAWLRRLNCDSSVFTLEEFLLEVEFVVKEAIFFLVMLMLRPLFANSENSKEVDSLQTEDFTDSKKYISPECQEKASFVVREVIRRGWIWKKNE